MKGPVYEVPIAKKKSIFVSCELSAIELDCVDLCYDPSTNEFSLKTLGNVLIQHQSQLCQAQHMTER